LKKALIRIWEDYFNFTKGERNAFVILIILTLGFSVYPLLDINAFKDKKTDFSELVAIAWEKRDSGNQDDQAETFQEYSEKHSSVIPGRFRFNPNTASVSELESLGFKVYIAKRIEKYRASGGKFRVRGDLKKVYGIDQKLVDLLWNDIDLPESLEKPLWENHEKTTTSKSPGQLVDLNMADTSQLIALPGIGSKLAQRIVDFRTKLGGFYSLEQLKEVYGLKPETIDIILPLLKLDISGITYLDINTADAKTLDMHPYINRNQANAIVEYRKQHGPYKSIEELSKIVVLDALLLNKIKTYIKF
jgi:competence protein ComEA